jgi:signal transduction histidine kinase
MLERSTQSELDALAVSYVKAYRLEYEKLLRDKRPQTVPAEGAPAGETPIVLAPEDFKKIASSLADTLELPCAWRVWDIDLGNVFDQSGRTDLLRSDAPLLDDANTNRTFTLPGGLRWRTEPLSSGFALGLMLDGSQQIGELRQYQVLAGALMVLAAMLSLSLGAYMTQRMSRMLRRVADSARAVRDPTREVVEMEVADAPDEIRDVVDALRRLFGSVRTESERSRMLYASMAHELRSPIQNLVGETEVALFTARDGDGYRRVLESNLDELRDLGDAIDNLVAICSERRPADHGGQEEFDLLDEARIRLERERAQAQRRGVELRLEGEGELWVRGDREGLLRALRNLAANAIQWSPDGGRVAVRLVGRNGEVEVTVDDAGPGIAEELREQIFEPFVRGPALGGQRIGYGLGLAITRAAVDAQGGTILIDRSPLGGARFQVRMPRVCPADGAVASPGQPAPETDRH